MTLRPLAAATLALALATSAAVAQSAPADLVPQMSTQSLTSDSLNSSQGIIVPALTLMIILLILAGGSGGGDYYPE